MNLKDKLDIVLITYNRKNCLQKTFEQIFAENSPIKDFDITILNNASTDGTSEFIEKYCKHSKGKWAGQLIKLELFQKAFIH